MKPYEIIQYKPNDIEEYKRFLKNVVERYDDDGVNEMGAETSDKILDRRQ